MNASSFSRLTVMLRLVAAFQLSCLGTGCGFMEKAGLWTPPPWYKERQAAAKAQQRSQTGETKYSTEEPKYNTEASGKVDFQLALNSNVIDSKTLRISGTISKSAREMIEFTYKPTYGDQTVPCPACNTSQTQILSGCGYCAGRRYITKTVQAGRERNVSRSWWVDQTVGSFRIWGSYFVEATPQVEDGGFSVELKLKDPKLSLTNLRARNYYKVMTYTSPSTIVVDPVNANAGEPKLPSRQVDAPSVYFYEADADGIRALAHREQTSIQRKLDALFVDVSIGVEDKITHTPISPVITVTGLASDSRDDLIAKRNELKHAAIDRMRNEIVEPDLIAQVVSSLGDGASIKEFLGKGEIKQHNGGQIWFRGIIGATYRIETRHPEYHYFSGTLKIERDGDLKKTILLIEKGQKLRIENVKEGQGGEMLDAGKE